MRFLQTRQVQLILIIIATLSGLCFWSRPPYDPDLGWHLNGGAWILNNLSQGNNLNQALPSFDFINSFNPIWHDYHWLGQLLMYFIYSKTGYLGLHFCFTALMVLIFLTFLSIHNKITYKKNNFQALLCLLPAFYLVYDVASVRPQMISIFFIAVALRILIERPKIQEILFLLVLSVLLANIHVYWIFIPFLWFSFRCLPRVLNRAYAPKAIYAWGGFFTLSLAGLASPYGIYHSNPTLANILMNYSLIWDYLNTPSYLQKIIIEFQSPMRAFGIVPCILLLWLILVTRAFSYKRMLAKFEFWFIGVVGFLLCFKAVKFIGIFAVFGLPVSIIAINNSSLIKKLSKSFLEKLLPLALSFIIAFIAIFSYPYKNKINNSLISFLPFDACNTLSKTKLQPISSRDHIRLLTHFNYGGWCRWIIYQQNPNLDIRVTTDGRTQGVPPDQFIKSFELYDLKEDWDKTLEQWNPDAILAAREHPLSHLLFKLPDRWKPIHQDGTFAVFTKNG